MKPQPPVTKMRTAPDSSGAAGVKRHTTDTKDAKLATIKENQIAKLILDAAFLVHTTHMKQLLTQLRLSGLKLGLLINFGVAHLRNGIRRVINGQFESAEIPDLAF